MTLTLGFSPCPNDTFIFDALVNKRIDCGDLAFDVRLGDVETLNQWALEGRLDITKISYGVLPLVTSKYSLLDAGGALGKGVGPLLVGLQGFDHAHISDSRVAIPGKHTTANLLFSLAFPGALNKEYMIFSDIEDAVLSGRVDCGVIIHENRFTYRQKGLVRLLDLGEFWESRTGAPIPLGGILIKNGFSPDLPKRVNDLIRKSLEYAFAHYPALPDYVREHAQAMDEGVMRQHIDLYVNDYSLSLGEAGRRAVDTLMQVASKPQSA